MRPLVPTPGFGKERAVRCLAFAPQLDTVTVENLSEVQGRMERGELVWLDLAQPTAEDMAVLQERFGLHPLAVEDATQWHERPKIEFYDQFCMVVAHAGTLDSQGVLVTHQVAIMAGDRYLITVRAYPLFDMEEVERRWHTNVTVPRDSTGLLYVILDTIVDGYFDLTERYQDRLERLESHLFDTESLLERTEREIFRFKRALTVFRAMVNPMRDILTRLTHVEIAPLKPELSRYFRDAYDHTLRVQEQIDTTRELVNSTLDIHLASQGHRQNEVSKQLTIIATIFLPLTYITGFFGQNFGWMVNSIANPQIFWFLGVGSQILTVIILFWYFRRRHWF